MEMTGKDFMSYENAAFGYYLYRELLLTQFLHSHFFLRPICLTNPSLEK